MIGIDGKIRRRPEALARYALDRMRKGHHDVALDALKAAASALRSQGNRAGWWLKP